MASFSSLSPASTFFSSLFTFSSHFLPVIDPTTKFGTCCHYLLPRYFNYCLIQTCLQWTTRLHYKERLGLKEAEQDSEMSQARCLRKVIPLHLKNTEWIKKFNRELTALTFGLTVDVLEKNEGFEEFANQNHLEGYLIHFDHSLDVIDLTIMILHRGKKVAWSKVRQKGWDHSAIPAHRVNKAWRYGQQGLQAKNLYSTHKAQPYRQVNAEEWGNQNLFELCVCCEENPQFTGNHTFFRIYTREGAIYSEGLYLNIKSCGIQSLKSPFNLKRGQIMEPDITEFWPNTKEEPCTIHTLAFAMTDDQLQAVLASLIKDRQQDLEVFHLFDSNCTIWSLKHAKIAGFNYKIASTSALKMLLNTRIGCVVVPLFFQKSVSYLAKSLPSFIKKIVAFPLIVLANIGLIFLGAMRISPELQQKIKELEEKKIKHPIKPFLNQFSAIFDSTKLQLFHPHTFVHQTFREIKQWRQQKIEQLNGQKAQLEQQMLLANALQTSLIKKQLEHLTYQRDFVLPYALPPQ